MSEKTAVVLLNLGGPSAPDAIEPYLRNFFSDKNIISLPSFIRLPLAKRMAAKRARGEAHETYMALGGKSPLLENTQSQAAALEQELVRDGMDARVFVAMRYWHPRAAQTVREITAWGAKRIVLLPLYPQYSTATTRSSFEEFYAELGRAGNTADVSDICCWPVEEGFIDASAELIHRAVSGQKDFRLIFSAHGLPERTIKKGDPYQAQVEATGHAIVKKMDIQGLDWSFAYQSRVGPLKWIGPSVEEELQRAAKDKKGVVIYPQAFVSEHAETLVELDQMYREKARNMGVPFYIRVSTVGTHPLFIAGLSRLAKQAATGADGKKTGCLAKKAGCPNMISEGKKKYA